MTYCPSSLTEEQESALVARMLAGDTEARNALLLDNLEVIEKFARRKPSFICIDLSRMQSDEFKSDLHFEILSKLHKFEPEPGRRVWMFVYNVCRFRLMRLTSEKGNRRTLKIATNQDGEHTIPIASDPGDYRGVEEIALLRVAVDNLSDEQKRIFKSFFDIDRLTFLPFKNPYKKDIQSHYIYRMKYNAMIQALRDYILESGHDFHFDLRSTRLKRNAGDEKFAKSDAARAARRESYNLSLAEKQAKNREKWAARRARDDARREAQKSRLRRDQDTTKGISA